MNGTTNTKALAIAAAALALTAGAAVAGTNSAAAPSVGGGSSARLGDGWPASSLSARQATREARAAARDDGGKVLRLIEVARRFQPIDVGEPGRSPGDSFIFESGIFTPGGDRVGRDVVECTLGIRTVICEATVQLTGRGKLMVSGAFFGGEPQIAVTGGTRAFRGASGQLFAVDQPDGTTDLVFQLTD